MDSISVKNIQLEKLALKIDKLRDVLNEISSVSEETEEGSERLKISKKMDNLIVKYMRVLYENKN